MHQISANVKGKVHPIQGQYMGKRTSRIIDRADSAPSGLLPNHVHAVPDGAPGEVRLEGTDGKSRFLRTLIELSP